MPPFRSTDEMVTEFLGLPEGAASRPARGAPKSMQELVERLKDEHGLEQQTPERNLVDHWESIFGEGLAARCSPARITPDNTLILAVANQTLRSELRFRKRDLLRKIQRVPGCERIRDLRFRTG